MLCGEVKGKLERGGWGGGGGIAWGSANVEDKWEGGLPVALTIPLTHGCEDAGCSWHVQAHGKCLCGKEALHISDDGSEAILNCQF